MGLQDMRPTGAIGKCYSFNVSTFRIALANLRFPATPEESVALAEQAVARAGREGAGIVCFPESYVRVIARLARRYRRRSLRSSNLLGRASRPAPHKRRSPSFLAPSA